MVGIVGIFGSDVRRIARAMAVTAAYVCLVDSPTATNTSTLSDLSDLCAASLNSWLEDILPTLPPFWDQPVRLSQLRLLFHCKFTSAIPGRFRRWLRPPVREPG